MNIKKNSNCPVALDFCFFYIISQNSLGITNSNDNNNFQIDGDSILNTHLLKILSRHLLVEDSMLNTHLA